MAKVKGKFFTLTGMLASNSPESVKKIDQFLEAQLGLNHLELDPDELYDTRLWNECIMIYANSFPNPEKAIVDLGRRVYPTIKRTVGLPDYLKSPKDFIKFELEGFQQNHSPDVKPRKILRETENSITIYAPAPDYDDIIYSGVWLGILEMLDIPTRKVEKIDSCTYTISW